MAKSLVYFDHFLENLKYVESGIVKNKLKYCFLVLMKWEIYIFVSEKYLVRFHCVKLKNVFFDQRFKLSLLKKQFFTMRYQ